MRYVNYCFFILIYKEGNLSYGDIRVLNVWEENFYIFKL